MKHIKKTFLITLIFVVKISVTSFAQNVVKPNILYIITDDQRKDSNGYYNEIVTGKKESPLGYVESPNLDALAKEGTVFTKMYCNSPACQPSRTSIITGKYPFRNGVYGFEYHHNQPDFFNKIMPEVMRDNGYETALFGKNGVYLRKFKQKTPLNFHYEKTVEATKSLRDFGVTDWTNKAIWGKVNGKSKKLDTRVNFYYPNGVNKSFSRSKNLSAEDKKTKAEVEKELDILYAYTRTNPDLIIGGVNSMPAGKTLDGNIYKEYSKYLQNKDSNYKLENGEDFEGATSSKPIFVNLSFHLPHTPVMPPKEFRDRFKNKTYNIPEFDKKEVEKLPKQMQDLYNKLKIDGLSYKDMQQAIRDYYAFCAYGDYLIGKAVKEFKTYSKVNNRPYVILYVCGDHGWHLGENGIEAKFTPWEMSTHTSAIAVSSDKKLFPAGKIYQDFTEYVDIMPTILSAGGVNISSNEYNYLDGYNLAEVHNNKKLKREYILGDFNHVAGPRAYIRTEDFAFSMQTRESRKKPGGKLKPNVAIKWGLEAPREDVCLALYDLRVDPLERNNVANNKSYIKLADWFRNKLGNIVLGDGRVECDWSQKNVFDVSNFAKGADNKKIEIPKKIIPKV
ncbi:sulfatase-like hydrolase/transferase [Lutibacter sp. TH_r2]|uniref:sulfatase-like hydrolase/transferase n=1 Tax=Lutibacter sp. TH_r2 TaxID=3082083 RepID=UPI002953CD0D|nr:sulfatase-like hydrolase/transferase [Lutibacter sp. TH_r2]MDV7185870.1 sulfatase-like hydrolase/transferase [Lutibacter sp. TH_r2]